MAWYQLLHEDGSLDVIWRTSENKMAPLQPIRQCFIAYAAIQRRQLFKGTKTPVLIDKALTGGVSGFAL